MWSELVLETARRQRVSLNVCWMKTKSETRHLDVRQSVSVHPVAGQTVDVLLPGQSQVVVATVGDVRCEDGDKDPPEFSFMRRLLKKSTFNKLK